MDDEVEIRERLVRIETKLDFLLLSESDKESRLRNLEKWRWGLGAGVLAALYPLAAMIGGLLTEVLKA